MFFEQYKAIRYKEEIKMKDRELSLLFLFIFIGVLLSMSFLFSNLWAISNVKVTNTPENELNPSISMNDSTIYLAWHVSENNIVNFSSSNNLGENWNPPIQIGSGNEPVVVVDTKGYVFIVWQNNGEILMRKSTNGINFEPSFVIGNGYLPDMAIDSCGNIYVIWQENIVYLDKKNTPIYFSKSVDGGNIFSEPIVVDTTMVGWNSPLKLAVSPCGNNIYVTWACPDGDWGAGYPVIAWFSRSTDGGTTFSPRINPTGFPGDGEFSPSIQAFGKNNVYIVLTIRSGGNDHLYITASTDTGVSWSLLDSKIDDGDYFTTDVFHSSPSMAIDKNGFIYVVWADTRDNDVSNNIYFDKSTDGGQSFGIDLRIDDSPEQSSLRNPSIAVSDTAKVGIVWEDNRNGNYDIYYDYRIATKIENPDKLMMEGFYLEQNYPNPFNTETIIEYNIPRFSKVIINIYNILGEEIAILIDGIKKPGVYPVNWNGKDKNGENLTSGIYICRIQAGDFSQIKKMVLIR